MTWFPNGIGDLFFIMILRVLYRHNKVSITLRKVQVTFILMCVIVVSEDFSKLIRFQVSLPFPFIICFLQLVRALEHNLLLCPFVSHFGFSFLAWTWDLLFVLPFPPLLDIFFNGACEGFIICIPMI